MISGKQDETGEHKGAVSLWPSAPESTTIKLVTSWSKQKKYRDFLEKYKPVMNWYHLFLDTTWVCIMKIFNFYYE